MIKNDYFNRLPKFGRYQITILVFGIIFNLVIFYASNFYPFQKLTPSFKCTSEDQKTPKTCTITEFCSDSTVKIKDEENKMVNWFVDFPLNCDNHESFFGLVFSGKFVALCLGQFLFGYLSDTQGRHSVLIILVAGLIVCNTTLLLTTNLGLITLFLITLYSFNLNSPWIIFMKENLQQPVFALMVSLSALKFTFVGASIGLVYEWTQDWKTLHYIVIGLAVFAFLIIVLFLTESPNYLALKGKKEEAIENFQFIKENSGGEEEWEPSTPPKAVEEQKEGFCSLFIGDLSFRKDFLLLTPLRMLEKFATHSIFMNLEIIDSNLLVTSQIYYIGAFFGSIGGGVIASKLGRVPSLKYSALLSFVSFLVIVVCFNLRTVKFISLGLISFSTCAFTTTIYIYMPEVFPMKVRSTASSFATVASNIVCILIPFVIHNQYSLIIHFVCFGIAFLISFFLKETLETKSTPEKQEEEKQLISS